MQQVIYAWNYFQWGGAQIYFLSLIRTVREEFEILVVLPEGSNKQLIGFIEDHGVRYSFFKPAFSMVHAEGLVGKLKMHLEKLRSETHLLKHLESCDLKNSIVHVDLGPWSSFLFLLRLSRRTRVFFTMHNSLATDSKLRRFVWKVKLQIISRFRNFNVFASNKDARDYFKGLYSDELFDRIAVTYTNVDLEEIDAVLNEDSDREAVCREYSLPSERFLVFCVGQFIDRKGRWEFLEAARKVREIKEDVTFVWIANSPPTGADIARADAYGLGEDFRLLTSDLVGESHADLMRLLSVADVFVLVSHIEGLPISLLEAMALKKPVISTNVNAIPEAVIHDETGLLVEPGDSSGLADAIVDLYDHEERRERLSEAGSAIVREKFVDKEAARIALDHYRAALL